MKKILFSLLFFISTYTFCQGYFDASVKGGYGLTVLLNKNLFDDGQIVPEFSFAHTYGGRFGFNFNEQHCLSFDIASSAFKQAYDIKTDSLKWNKSINLTTLDMALIYRNYVEGTYFEIGPQMSLLQKATEKSSLTGDQNIKNYIEPSYYGAVIGFGANMFGSDNINFLMGFRATYGFNDLISSNGRNGATSYPMNETQFKPKATAYKASHPLTVRLMLEVNFDLGYFTHSNCNKKRAKFITF